MTLGLSIRKKLIISLFILLCLKMVFTMHGEIFNDPYSTVLNDNKGNLIGARIADDGQWRFPISDKIPYKFERSLLMFEDEYFYYHLGVNPISICKAIYQNISAGEVVRGGSTLTLQVARMSRKGRSRNIYEKLIECFLAIKYELNLSKDEILRVYSAHAPFGGNVVGLEAAAWRYFGRPSEKLSWAESAMLAVLPNAPSLIYPGKNQKKLLIKRNRLLDKLFKNGELDSLSCELAKLEPLPQKPKPLPMVVNHLLDRAISEGYKGKILNSTIDTRIQKQVNRVVDKYHRVLYQNEIKNAAVLVVEVKTGNVLAYVGNTKQKSNDDGNFVDIVTAPRSSGSILKPFLYALMQRDGEILPSTIIPDIPTRIAGYKPQNFDKKYDGVVPADQALSRSLNIPAIRMLRRYSPEKFLFELQKLKFSTINRSSEHYGLSLILGGAEVTLWDVVSAYTGMARELREYENDAYNENPKYYIKPSYLDGKTGSVIHSGEMFTEPAIWHTFEALSDMDRPLEGVNWRLYNSSRKIAWKTGTSYGFRDAWCVGITTDYVVGVWIGNADGEGRPGLTGSTTAAPVMFDIYKNLPQTKWFTAPDELMITEKICKQSGHKASEFCTDVIEKKVSPKGNRTSVCPFHKEVFLDENERYRVNSACYSVAKMKRKSWFILPPVMEWYYRSKSPFYKSLPPVHPDCKIVDGNNIGIIYPEKGAKIYLPRNLNSIIEKTVLEASHRDNSAKIFWHLNDQYLGETVGFHQMEVQPKPGNYKLVLIDDKGEEITRRFTVLE